MVKQQKETEAQLEQAQQELQQQRQEASQEREDHESQMIGLRETIRQVCRVLLRCCCGQLTGQVCGMQRRPSISSALIAMTSCKSMCWCGPWLTGAKSEVCRH